MEKSLCLFCVELIMELCHLCEATLWAVYVFSDYQCWSFCYLSNCIFFFFNDESRVSWKHHGTQQSRLNCGTSHLTLQHFQVINCVIFQTLFMPLECVPNKTVCVCQTWWSWAALLERRWRGSHLWRMALITSLWSHHWRLTSSRNHFQIR